MKARIASFIRGQALCVCRPTIWTSLFGLLNIQVRHHRIKARILRDDLKASLRVLHYQSAEVVGDVEVQGIVPAALHLDVFRVLAERLQRACQGHPAPWFGGR